LRLSAGERHANLLASLDRAALEPAEWSIVCDHLAGLGAILVPADTAENGPELPHSPSLQEGHRKYLEGGWHKRDFRIIQGFPKAGLRGYVTDQDIISPEAMRRHPYYREFLGPLGLKWFLAATFAVNGRMWAASVQGTEKRGPFQTADIELLLKVRQDLGLAARSAAAMGHQRVETADNLLGAGGGRGLLALDAAGRISWLNGAAESILRAAKLGGRGQIRSEDAFHNRRLSNLIEGSLNYRWSPGRKLSAPVRVRTDGRKFTVDAVPMPRDFQALLSGVTVLVTIHEVEPAPPQPVEELKARYRLTPKEGELADKLASGAELKEAADGLGMTVATARSHLKAIFQKTGVSRQAQLVAPWNRA
jgi:DNA-binding CsgD family transcriptional regulator